MRTGKPSPPWKTLVITNNDRSIQFNVVSKGLGSERMSFYLNEAAGDIRDLLMPTLEAPKAKL
jgi:carnitine O-acetyltransferase